jgi:hypothetical protein
MSEPKPIWIKLRPSGRSRSQGFHAVYCQALGMSWTYCGRGARLGSEIAAATDDFSGIKRCLCCQRRIRKSYLVPDEIRALRRVEPLDVALVAPDGLFRGAEAP